MRTSLVALPLFLVACFPGTSEPVDDSDVVHSDTDDTDTDTDLPDTDDTDTDPSDTDTDDTDTDDTDTDTDDTDTDLPDTDTDDTDTDLPDTDTAVDTDTDTAVDTDTDTAVDTDDQETDVVDPNDRDGDGVPVGTDCDDEDAGVGLPAAGHTPDLDGDHHGALDGELTLSCTLPPGWLGNNDCDDEDDETYPGAEEYCDEADNDCDEAVDEDPVDVSMWAPDADGDSFGDLYGTMVSACWAPEGYAWPEDCDDENADVNPWAAEVCNGLDDNCDNNIDDDLNEQVWWYEDLDGDGWGGEAATRGGCTPPAVGMVTTYGDCNDDDREVNPGAAERCATPADDDCDGSVNEADAEGATTWYADADGDGVGSDETPTTACDRPSGTVGESGDCDDSDPLVYPGAPEVCDGVANGCTAEAWFPSDEDGLVSFFGDDGSAWTTDSIDFTGDQGLDAGVYAFCRGDWTVHLVADDVEVTLVSVYGPEETVLYGDGARVIEAADSDVTVSGLQLADGVADDGGGGLVSATGGALTIHDSILRDGTAPTGGCVYASGTTDLSVLGTDLTSCTATSGPGGGIVAHGPAAIEDTGFTSCRAAAEGGGFLVLGAPLRLSNVRVATSTAVGAGGGASVRVAGTAVLENLSFLGNRVTAGVGEAGDGGGLAVRTAGPFTLTIDGLMGNGNQATGRGGGAYVEVWSYTTLRGFRLDANQADTGGNLAVVMRQFANVLVESAVPSSFNLGRARLGGGLAVDASAVFGQAPFNMSMVEIRDNLASEEGGGIYAVGGDLVLFDVRVWDNLIGPLSAEDPPSTVVHWGAGASLRGSRTRMLFTQFSRNRNVAAGDPLNGGAMAVVGGTLEFQGGAMVGNAATRGAGLYYATIEGSPGISGSSYLSLNRATQHGGAAFIERGTLEWGPSDVAGNDASLGGGGVWIEPDSTLQVRGGSFGSSFFPPNTVGGVTPGNDVAWSTGFATLGASANRTCTSTSGCL